MFFFDQVIPNGDSYDDDDSDQDTETINEAQKTILDSTGDQRHKGRHDKDLQDYIFKALLDHVPDGFGGTSYGLVVTILLFSVIDFFWVAAYTSCTIGVDSSSKASNSIIVVLEFLY